MKKLLIDINSVVPLYSLGKTNGIGRTTKELVEALDKLEKDLPFKLILYSQNMKGIGGRNLDISFPTKHFYLPHRKPLNKFFKKFPLKEKFASYDLMHIPHNFEYVFNPQKTIVTLHDAFFMKINEKAFNHLKMRNTVPELIQNCKGVITCSEASKKDIVETMQIDPRKIDVIYWGIKHQVFFPRKNKELVKDEINNKFHLKKPFFFSVSCNAERKNTHLLVDAYLELCKHCPKNDLVLVWGNPPATLVTKIQGSGYASRIHFVTRIDDEALALLYNGATALVFPSAYEGFGLPVLESMACGCPVVIGDNSSLPEVGGSAAIYLKSLTVPGILETLENMENNSYNLPLLIKKGIKQASRFTWQKTAAIHNDIYQKYLELN
ncbi:MAG: glycosyltransferase family 4 protein [Bacteroidota bacterium]